MNTTTTAPNTRNTWDIDVAHSSLGFSVRHLVIAKVHGRFARWTGSLVLDDARPEDSRVEVHIESASLDTHEPQRDAHLRSADFFDSDHNPELVFRSTRIERAGDDRYTLSGDLTIAGVTRPARLEVEALGRAKDPWGGDRIGFSAKTTIDRRDFGLVWNQALEAGGVVVGEKVEITIEVEAVRRAEQPPSQAA